MTASHKRQSAAVSTYSDAEAASRDTQGALAATTIEAGGHQAAAAAAAANRSARAVPFGARPDPGDKWCARSSGATGDPPDPPPQIGRGLSPQGRGNSWQGPLVLGCLPLTAGSA